MLSKSDGTPEVILVERTSEPNGNTHEVYVIGGQLVVVESWSADEVTVPDAPHARAEFTSALRR